MGTLVVLSFLLFQNNPTIATITTPVRGLLHGGTFIALGGTNNKAFLAQGYRNVPRAKRFPTARLPVSFLPGGTEGYWPSTSDIRWGETGVPSFDWHTSISEPLRRTPLYHYSSLCPLFCNVNNFGPCIAWVALLISVTFSETPLIDRDVAS